MTYKKLKLVEKHSTFLLSSYLPEENIFLTLKPFKRLKDILNMYNESSNSRCFPAYTAVMQLVLLQIKYQSTETEKGNSSVFLLLIPFVVFNLFYVYYSARETFFSQFSNFASCLSFNFFLNPLQELDFHQVLVQRKTKKLKVVLLQIKLHKQVGWEYYKHTH